MYWRRHSNWRDSVSLKIVGVHRPLSISTSVVRLLPWLAPLPTPIRQSDFPSQARGLISPGALFGVPPPPSTWGPFSTTGDHESVGVLQVCFPCPSEITENVSVQRTEGYWSRRLWETSVTVTPSEPRGTQVQERDGRWVRTRQEKKWSNGRNRWSTLCEGLIHSLGFPNTTSGLGGLST